MNRIDEGEDAYHCPHFATPTLGPLDGAGFTMVERVVGQAGILVLLEVGTTTTGAAVVVGTTTTGALVVVGTTTGALVVVGTTTGALVVVGTTTGALVVVTGAGVVPDEPPFQTLGPGML